MCVWSNWPLSIINVTLDCQSHEKRDYVAWKSYFWIEEARFLFINDCVLPKDIGVCVCLVHSCTSITPARLTPEWELRQWSPLAGPEVQYQINLYILTYLLTCTIYCPLLISLMPPICITIHRRATTTQLQRRFSYTHVPEWCIRLYSLLQLLASPTATLFPFMCYSMLHYSW